MSSWHRFKVGECFAFECVDKGGDARELPWALVIVSNVARNVPFGWFFGPYPSLESARDAVGVVDSDEFVYRAKFGATGVESGEWVEVGFRKVSRDEFPLPPMTSGHIARNGPAAGLQAIEIFDECDLLFPIEERWVDPNAPENKRLPSPGLDGAIFVQEILSKKFASSDT